MRKVVSTFSILTILCLALDCKAQQPVSPGEGAALTWTQSASCTTAAPCPSYLILREAVASATTKCDVTTGTFYATIATVATANVTAYNDNSVIASGFYCWAVQAQQGTPLQNGPASLPSNSGVALQLTEPPLAPGAPAATETTAAADVPSAPGSVQPSVQLSSSVSNDMHLTVTVFRR